MERLLLKIHLNQKIILYSKICLFVINRYPSNTIKILRKPIFQQTCWAKWELRQTYDLDFSCCCLLNFFMQQGVWIT